VNTNKVVFVDNEDIMMNFEDNLGTAEVTLKAFTTAATDVNED